MAAKQQKTDEKAAKAPSPEEKATSDTSTQGPTLAEQAATAPDLDGDDYRQGYIGFPPSVEKGEDLTIAGVLKRQKAEG